MLLYDSENGLQIDEQVELTTSSEPNQDTGPPLSFDELVVPLWDEMMHYVQKLTRSPQDAQDVVQDAFIRALRWWPTWRPAGDPEQYARAWMFRIAHHTYCMMYKRDKRARLRAEAVRREPSYQMPVDPPEPAGFCDEVAEALAKLSPDRREAVHAVYILGMSAKEYARLSGVPENTVGTRLSRARADLGRLLERVAPALGLKQRRVA